MSQLKGKYLVFGGGENPEGGLWENESGGILARGFGVGRSWGSYGWGRSLRLPAGGVWSFKNGTACILAGG